MKQCKGCVNREVGCHSMCESYAEDRKVWDEIAATRRDERIACYTSANAQRKEKHNLNEKAKRRHR